MVDYSATGVALTTSHILILVFTNIPRSQLPSVAQVCQAWYDAAMRVLYTRIRFLLPFTLDPNEQRVNLETPWLRLSRVLELAQRIRLRRKYPPGKENDPMLGSMKAKSKKHPYIYDIVGGEIDGVRGAFLEAIDTLVIRKPWCYDHDQSTLAILESIRPRHLVLYSPIRTCTQVGHYLREAVSQVEDLTLEITQGRYRYPDDSPWCFPNEVLEILRDIGSFECLRFIIVGPRPPFITVGQGLHSGINITINIIVRCICQIVDYAHDLPKTLTIYNLVSTSSTHFKAVRQSLTDATISTNDLVVRGERRRGDTPQALIKRLERTKTVAERLKLVGAEEMRKTDWHGGFTREEIDEYCRDRFQAVD